MNPSTQDILTAVNQVPAETVFVFPNNKNIIMAAEQVDPLTEKTVIVIPSTTIPQAFTAMLSYDPEGSKENNVEAMTGALDQVDTMQITYAARDSDFDGHQIHQGDYLAMYGKSLSATSRDLNAVLRSLAEKVRDTGREYITIFTERTSQKSRPPRRPVSSPLSVPMPTSTCCPGDNLCTIISSLQNNATMHAAQAEGLTLA